VKSVEVFEITKLRIRNYELGDCKFGYRDSIFKHNKNLIILSATLQLKEGQKREIQKKIKEYLKYRRKKQPLNFPSAGSIFKNPQGILTKELAKKDKFSFLPFAAAQLIEKCGLKGKRIGNVRISEKHANFIVNLGEGKAKDVRKLINLIKKRVKKKFGIDLEEEIQYLGF
jgi:UDP-N-acetylmuramate dehydrogenase